jgi:hypothetical protein
MQALSTSELLDLWEAGRSRCNVERGLLLLRAARPELDRDAQLDMPIGERDAHLLAVREATFGATAALIAGCHACGEQLELECPLSAALAAPNDLAGGSEPFGFECGENTVCFRLPTSRDLASVRDALSNLEGASRALLSRCVSVVDRAGTALDCATLSDAEVAAIVQRMQDADPRAYLALALRCPSCGRSWSEALDVVACLWTELSALAARTLRQVHVIASCYGWNEQRILRLSSARRQLYVEMASP